MQSVNLVGLLVWSLHFRDLKKKNREMKSIHEAKGKKIEIFLVKSKLKIFFFVK